MTDLELQTVRDFILRAAKRFPRGVTAAMLRMACSGAGLELAENGEDSLDDHLLYLESGGFLKRLPKLHTPSLELWGVTRDGDDYLRLRKLA
jgi:hypothetical protein